MKISALFAALVILLAAFALALPDSAEAARMGGGRSFGSRPYMSTPAQRPAMRQQAPAANARNAQATAQRPGMFGGMGGLFGGLLAGTLLGSLLSGNGLGGGGGILDILLIGLLIYVGLKLFARFRQRQSQEPAPAGGLFGAGRQDLTNDSPNQPFARSNTQASGWDALRNLTGQGSQPPAAEPAVDVPAGFDAEEFLRGAKMAYTRMQQAWDRRDLDDIAQFATPAVMEALREQMASDPNPGKTEIMLVNAQLLGAENEGDDQRAQVFFDVLLRERPDQDAPSSAREVWHFLREGANGTWKLDGIQQVE
ncbi:MAG: Tim44 domain-containing protein [Desulfovibrio sp.]|uniref:Tim44 domain-containing protein n=1 Tax=Desulfovibrio sp. TaxID=885 RepID=UPI001A790E70|nr:Tim44-like domain-containing protein [Desulfovibrio sp.]MBD5416558.1 Tim44 domain-containing protein [Desulfovibrio sp.]